MRWLDTASERAAQKINDRENMFARMRAEGSPTQRWMRKMQKEQQDKEAQGKEGKQREASGERKKKAEL